MSNNPEPLLTAQEGAEALRRIQNLRQAGRDSAVDDAKRKASTPRDLLERLRQFG